MSAYRPSIKLHYLHSKCSNSVSFNCEHCIKTITIVWIVDLICTVFQLVVVSHTPEQKFSDLSLSLSNLIGSLFLFNYLLRCLFTDGTVKLSKTVYLSNFRSFPYFLRFIDTQLGRWKCNDEQRAQYHSQFIANHRVTPNFVYMGSM